MNKKLTFILSLAAALLMSCTDLFGQAQIVTRKYRISNFTTKTLEVVIPGDDFQSLVFQDEVRMRWRISPFEFCTMQEYESMKKSPDHYFLIYTASDGADISSITLFKGGVDRDQNPDKQRYEIVSVPISSATNPSGREFYCMGAVIDIIQDFVTSSMTNENGGFSSLRAYNSNLKKARGKILLIHKDEINPGAEKILFPFPAANIVEEEEIAKAMKEGTPNTLVSFVVAPSDPSFGSTSYHMLIDASTHQLYYYKKTFGRGRKQLGFSAKELKRIANACK